jgi:hypothetical protein
MNSILAQVHGVIAQLFYAFFYFSLSFIKKERVYTFQSIIMLASKHLSVFLLSSAMNRKLYTMVMILKILVRYIFFLAAWPVVVSDSLL